MKRTPLYQTHVDLGARMTEFGGWDMPVMYPTGILEEHMAVRKGVGIFDISHMGEIKVTGPQALDLLQYLTTNDVSKLEVGQAQYTFFTAENGGIRDDCIISRMPDYYYVVVNAGPAESDYQWLAEHGKKFDATVTDLSAETAKLDIQGPLVEGVLQKITDVDLSPLGYFHCTTGKVGGVNCLISRTGYTGEDGFELYCNWNDVKALWDACMAAGDVVPCGLGARDTLRLEVGLPLSGDDINLNTTPVETGFGWAVKLQKGDFIGKAEIEKYKAEPRLALVGFEMIGRGIARHGQKIAIDGKEVGVVTSGAFAPMLNKNIGMGHVPPQYKEIGTKIEIIVRDKPVEAVIVQKPFYKEASAKRPKKG